MKIIDLAQGTKEWLEFRRNGIGSSDISAIYGSCPYKSAYDVYQEKEGFQESKEENSWMTRGKLYESEAREQVEKKLGMTFPPIVAVDDVFNYFYSSFDGYNPEHGKIIEIKIPGPKIMQQIREGKIPLHYQIQMDWQLYISRLESAYFCAYWPESAELLILEHEIDTVRLSKLIESAKSFWECYQKGILPELSQEDYLYINDANLERLISEYSKRDAEEKKIQKEKKALREKILDYGDGGNFSCKNLKASWTQRTSYDFKAMEKDGIDIKKYVKKSFYYTLKVGKAT